MPTETRKPSDTWAPLYFLASVGAGGIAVSFFVWLLFWVPHPGRSVPHFGDIQAAFVGGSPVQQGMIAAAVLGIAVFAFLNLRLLVWNLTQSARWTRTEAAAAHAATNAQSQRLVLPLALAMSVNVGFILGLVFVPGLWSVVEWLFPLAMAAFVAIGILAFRLIAEFLGRVLVKGGFACQANNNFGQMLPAFALAMVGVGLSAPAAMSTVAATAGVALILSTFFFMASAVIAGLAFILGVRAMMENGINIETAPTLTIVVPLMTVLGILLMRQDHGLHTHFGVHGDAGETFRFLTRLLSVQVLFLLFGGYLLARLGYFARLVFGRDASVQSYALVCPGVALSVMMMFWINKGLVDAGLIAKFGAAYWALSGVAVTVQVATIALVLVLNRKHFGTPRDAGAVPAE